MAESPLEDQELLRQLRKGNETAFTALYERYQGPIYRFALHMSGNTATAEEVTQEAAIMVMGSSWVIVKLSNSELLELLRKAVEIGAGLATAFRRHHARRRLVRRVSIAALAACLALAAGLISMRSRHEAPSREIVKEHPRVIPVKTPEPVTLSKAATTPPRSVKKHATPKATNSNLAAAFRREFLALPGYDPAVPADELSIVRVRLPASALWQMGAPVNPDSGARKFMADFVVSQDGTPYAVRLVR